MWVARGMLVAQKEARSLKFVSVAAGKDISQETRAVQHVTRPAGSVEKSVIFKLNVWKVTGVVQGGSRVEKAELAKQVVIPDVV